MLTDILGLSDRELEQILKACLSGSCSRAGIHQSGRPARVKMPAHPGWLTEAMARFGSVERLSALIRLVREQRSQLASAHPAPELILTGPEAEGIAARDTRRGRP